MVNFRMFCDGRNMIYLGLPPYVCAAVLHTIFKNNIMKHHYFLAIHMCVCFLLVTFLITLSKACNLRRKPEAVSKPLSRLYDSDLESDDDDEITEVSMEKETNPLWVLIGNFFLFCRFRHIYAVVAVVGSLLLIPFLVSFAGWYLFDTVSLEDLGSAFAMLACAAIFIEYLVLIVSNMQEIYTSKPSTTSYRPFDELVKVPMKVFVSKVLALCVKDIYSSASNLFYQLSAIYGLMVVYSMPEKDKRMFEETSGVVGIYEIMKLSMVMANMCGVFFLFESLWTPCLLTKERLLMTFEKNWERNLKAFEFLLPDKEVATLEELRDALLEKSNKKNLTEEEQKTLQYIERPMWKSKRVFLDKAIVKRPWIKLLVPPKESPDNPPSAKPSKDKPSTSASQASTTGVTTRQLRSRKAR